MAWDGDRDEEVVAGADEEAAAAVVEGERVRAVEVRRRRHAECRRAALVRGLLANHTIGHAIGPPGDGRHVPPERRPTIPLDVFDDDAVDAAHAVVAEVAHVDGAVRVDGDAADGVEERFFPRPVAAAAVPRARDGRDLPRDGVEDAHAVAVGDEDAPVGRGGEVVDDAEARVAARAVGVTAIGVHARHHAYGMIPVYGHEAVRTVAPVRHGHVARAVRRDRDRARPRAVADHRRGTRRRRHGETVVGHGTPTTIRRTTPWRRPHGADVHVFSFFFDDRDARAWW
mmetsp:Transcript_26043/g.104203  ORF Transcript_26043/g.104203 Transcript_26043/m.104203 type:complete len:285 (-) Transcript_26043:184-1038(-)